MKTIEQKILEKMQALIKNKKVEEKTLKQIMLEQQYAYSVNFKIFNVLMQKKIINKKDIDVINTLINAKELSISVTQIAKRTKIDIRTTNKILNKLTSIFFVKAEYDISKKHKIVKYTINNNVKIFEDALTNLTKEKVKKFEDMQTVTVQHITKKSVKLQQEQKKNLNEFYEGQTVGKTF